MIMNQYQSPVGRVDDDAVITEMPCLRIEVSHREDMVILEQQDFGGDPPSRMAVHALQVRLLAEHFGLFAPIDPDVRQHLKTIATLARRLRVLHDRIDHLGHYLHYHSDSERANLEYEQTYALASREIAHEFIVDLDDLVSTQGETEAAGILTAARAEPQDNQNLASSGVLATQPGRSPCADASREVVTGGPASRSDDIGNRRKAGAGTQLPLGPGAEQ